MNPYYSVRILVQSRSYGKLSRFLSHTETTTDGIMVMIMELQDDKKEPIYIDKKRECALYITEYIRKSLPNTDTQLI